MSSFVDKHLKSKSWLSCGLWIFSLVYKVVVAIKRKNSQPMQIEGVKIVGVGNIVCGGSGKTPFDIALVRYLQSKGQKVAVSVRGYKGGLESQTTLISDRQKVLSEAAQAGDEALLLAESLPKIPVVVGKDRLAAVRCLLRKFYDLDVIVLEDSFQNFKVAHDFDFVLFKANVGLGNGWCLPAGYLREGVSALKYADAIVLDGSNLLVENLANRYGKQLLKGEIVTKGFWGVDGKEINVQRLQKGVCYCLSAIADPHSFERQVAKSGIRVEKKFAFDDHHHFRDLPLQELAKADFVLVTDKDLVKLRDYEILRSKLVCLRIDYQIGWSNVRGLL